MKKNLAVTLVVCALLAACGKTPPAEVAPASSEAAPAGTPATRPAVDPTKQAHLMGGYVPQFEHRVRSQRHEPAGDGKYRHVVIVEFIGLDAAAVGAKLQEELAGRGLTVKEPIERGEGTVRYQAQNSKVGIMFADVTGSSKLELGPGANGTIYFSWQDRNER